MEQFFLKNSFSDFDDFAHTVQAFDLDFQQLDMGDFKANLIQLAIGNKSLLSYFQFNRRLDQRGSPPLSNWTFAIFSEQSTPIIWHEQEISNNTIVIYKPGADVDCVSRPGFEVFTLSYTEEHLNAICTCLRLPEVQVLLQGSDCFSCNSADLSESRLQLHRLSDTTRHLSTEAGKASLKHCFDFELPELVLSVFARSRPVKNNRHSLRTRSIKMVKEYLATYPMEPVTVSQLCMMTEVSERTLQYAFQDQYGVSPKTYLRNFRLNGSRRELLQSDCEIARVNDVASVWGFWHMGQFAADYHNLFGELPSETLQKQKMTKC